MVSISTNPVHGPFHRRSTPSPVLRRGACRLPGRGATSGVCAETGTHARQEPSPPPPDGGTVPPGAATRRGQELGCGPVAAPAVRVLWTFVYAYRSIWREPVPFDGSAYRTASAERSPTSDRDAPFRGVNYRIVTHKGPTGERSSVSVDWNVDSAISLFLRWREVGRGGCRSDSAHTIDQRMGAAASPNPRPIRLVCGMFRCCTA